MSRPPAGCVLFGDFVEGIWAALRMYFLLLSAVSNYGSGSHIDLFWQKSPVELITIVSRPSGIRVHFLEFLGEIPNVTDTQGVRIFQTDRAPTGAEGPAPRVERRLGTGMGFADRRPPGQQCAAGIGTHTGTHLPWLSYRVLAPPPPRSASCGPRRKLMS
jgi:hypothetical protein